MKKIDWYILKKFLGTFFYAICILVVISVVVDISEKLDDFTKSGLTVKQIIFQYYIAFIPHIAALLFPLFVFIAVIFFTSRLAYNSEIIAILGGGVSMRRILRAYWIGAILLAIMLSLGNRWVVPHAERVRTTFEDRYVHEQDPYSPVSNIHLRIDLVSYVSIFNYDPTYKIASGFKLEKIKDERLLSKLEAQSVTWDSTKKVWRTSLCFVRTINGLHESIRRVTDTALQIPLKPADLLTNHNLMITLTTPELNQYIAQEKMRGSEGINAMYVEKYRRDAAPAAVIILTIIGAVIASRKIRGGSGLHLAIGLCIGAVYIFLLQFSYTFSTKGTFNPFIAVWLPNVVFAALAYILYRRAPK